MIEALERRSALLCFFGLNDSIWLLFILTLCCSTHSLLFSLLSKILVRSANFEPLRWAELDRLALNCRVFWINSKAYHYAFLLSSAFASALAFSLLLFPEDQVLKTLWLHNESAIFHIYRMASRFHGVQSESGFSRLFRRRCGLFLGKLKISGRAVLRLESIRRRTVAGYFYSRNKHFDPLENVSGVFWHLQLS